eukprot:1384120-Ditylum_brightwellii.AAC.1
MTNQSFLSYVPESYRVGKLSISQILTHDTIKPSHMSAAPASSIDNIGCALGCGFSYVGMNPSYFIDHQVCFYTAWKMGRQNGQEGINIGNWDQWSTASIHILGSKFPTTSLTMLSLTKTTSKCSQTSEKSTMPCLMCNLPPVLGATTHPPNAHKNPHHALQMTPHPQPSQQQTMLSHQTPAIPMHQ